MNPGASGWAHKAPVWITRGFTRKEILERSEDFVEYLEEHGMLSAGTASLQGRTPKFLMTQGKNGLWYADAALPDDEAARHFLVKLSPGRNLADWKILENEAAYLQVAKEMGLFVADLPIWQSDMLFMPRFDRALAEKAFSDIRRKVLYRSVKFSMKPECRPKTTF